MSEFEFLVMAIGNWPAFAALSVFFAVVLFLSIRKIIVGGLFDPLTLALVAGYSINYAVVAFLYLQGQISHSLAALVLVYGLSLILVFRWRSRRQGTSLALTVVKTLTPRHVGPAVFKLCVALHLVLSVYIIASIGFGIFAETNRFDAARGFGSYIRILDFLTPFITSYASLHILRTDRRKLLKSAALLFFIGYAAMVNGAKISVIFSLFTVFFTMSIVSAKVKIRPVVAVSGLLVGILFSLLALSINLDRNNVVQEEPTTELAGAGLLTERFVYRLIASGDTSYLLLPNDVIDKIETDSVFVRFLVPFLGVTGSTALFGYPVENYAVGRQALLYYDPGYEVFGGPTSHFDLFSYVYFGPVAGWIFVMVLGLLLGSINAAIRTLRKQSRGWGSNHFAIALTATLWARAVLVIVEPTVALAYVIDVLLFFGLVSGAIQLLLPRPGNTFRVRAHPHALPESS